MQIWIGIILYHLIGMLMALKQIYDHPEARDRNKVPLEWKIQVLDTIIWTWPKHIFVMIGLKICESVDHDRTEE